MWSYVTERCYLAASIGCSTPSYYLSAEVNFVAAHQFLFSIFQHNSWLMSSVHTHTQTHRTSGEKVQLLLHLSWSQRPPWKLARGWWTPGGLGLSVWLMFCGRRGTNDFLYLSLITKQHSVPLYYTQLFTAAQWMWAGEQCVVHLNDL